MNKTWSLGLAVVTTLGATLSAAWAAGQPWACQYTASAGLRWDDNRWQTTSFETNPPFILVMEGNNLTSESVAIATRGAAKFASIVKCTPREHVSFDHIFCQNAVGDSLVFSPTTGQGGISKIIGAMQDGPKPRDTLHVSHFTCQKY